MQRLYQKLYYCIHSYCSLESSPRWGNTSNAFIFSLHNKEGIGAFKSLVRDPSRAIYSYSQWHGPRFGALRGGGHDIYIANYANSNQRSYTNFGHSYSVPGGVQNRSTLLAGTYTFTPDDWEVFYPA